MFEKFIWQISFLFIFLFLPESTAFCQSLNKILTGDNIVAGDVVTAAKWSDDKKSAFSFTFDDGFISHYENVRPILNQFNLKGTFYVMPAFLTESLPGIYRYGTWPMFQLMSLERHEIGSHSMTHPHLLEMAIGDTTEEGTILYELFQSRQLINQRMPNQSCITFAYPFAEHNTVIDSLTSLFYESARADGNEPNSFSPSFNQWYSLSTIEVHFNEPRETPEDDLDELIFLQNWVDSSIANQTWGILLGHEVVPFDSLAGLFAAGTWHPYSNEWFMDLCEWMQTKSEDKDLWIETVANVTKYIKERDNFFYSVLTQKDSQIKINISDNLNDQIYNYPLTVFIKVPESWEYALLIQGEKLDTLRAIYHESGTRVMANIIPDGGIISLFKLSITGVEDFADNVLNEYKLYQNYPNPFNPETNIRFTISDFPEGISGYTSLIVYDVLGNEIAILVNEEKSAGTYEVNFNAKNLSSGVYIYMLRAASKILTRKMIVTK